MMTIAKKLTALPLAFLFSVNAHAYATAACFRIDYPNTPQANLWLFGSVFQQPADWPLIGAFRAGVQRHLPTQTQCNWTNCLWSTWAAATPDGRIRESVYQNNQCPNQAGYTWQAQAAFDWAPPNADTLVLGQLADDYFPPGPFNQYCGE